ncbi:MAG: tetratricopeptide repeat protein [Nanoarchaeota archaeon]|nr:tetratricopeptide repeat protein [Nanoarchaeota archaeon]
MTEEGPLEEELILRLSELLMTDPDEQAVASMMEEINSTPLDTGLYLRLGDLLRDNCKIEQAITEYKAAARLQPDDPEPPIRLGDLYTDVEAGGKAMAEYSRVMAMTSDPGALRRIVSGVCFSGGNNDYEKLWKKYHSGSFDWNFLHGFMNLEQDPGLAGVYFNKAIDIDKSSPLGHVGLGLFQVCKEKKEDAVKSFRTAIELDPQDPLAHLFLGLMMEDTSGLEQAIDHYRQAVSVRPYLFRAQFLVGEAERMMRNHDAALEAYEKALKLNPEHPEGHLSIGLLYHTMRNMNLAEHHLRLAIKHDRESAAPHYHLGNILHELGKDGEAEEEFGCAYYKESKNPKANYQRGRFLRETDNKGMGRFYLNQAFELCSPDKIPSRYVLALARAQEEDRLFIQDALQTFKKGVEANRNDSGLFFAFGSYLERQSDFNGAALKYRRAVELDGKNKQYVEALQRVLRR